MAQNIDFDKYLAAAGFGESVSLGGKRNRKVKPKAPNPVAYAESYAFIRNDATRMELENVRMHVKVARIKASGEAFDDIKDKVVTTVKDGYSKVKKTLIELYEKAIRFFTETVRYFFSNEKKVGKMLAQIKASLKRTAKDGDGKVKIPTKWQSNTSADSSSYTEDNSGAGESFGYGRRGYGEADQEAKPIIDDIYKKANYSTVISDIEKISEDDMETYKEKVDEVIRNWKENIGEKKEVLENFLKNKDDDKADVKYAAAETATKKILIEYQTIFEEIRKAGSDRSMKAMNKEIRTLQEELKKLKKEFKENKNHSEEDNKKFQKSRYKITAKVKFTNLFKGVNDRMLGILMQGANLVMTERAKATK